MVAQIKWVQTYLFEVPTPKEHKETCLHCMGEYISYHLNGDIEQCGHCVEGFTYPEDEEASELVLWPELEIV